ncbi:Fic family protein [Micromonospora sp. AMSO12t]|uniref:Fic family protein n=1 Tax=Micromonospora sp. AMSO12t TaxID=2650410 RepID=UPI001788E6B5|nr:Fic family protein [Micromonospora sp. AMSO12t]
MAPKNHIWEEITGVPEVSEQTASFLRKLEPLQHAWQEAAKNDPDSFQETRLRALRSHAIETGIIERLYDVDWGVTEALVAEGISQGVIERTGGSVGAEALSVIKDQYEALEFVSESARGERPFSTSFIRELHALITRHQLTYDATDTLGNPVKVELLHGEWKVDANHVTRPDGSTLEYCPPLRVQDQMESLVRFYESDDSHPIIRAAWLHHRFISIHPFQDGNGRVARALVLLELLRAHYAPLVVGRDTRSHYIKQLDAANDGDLEPLILLLADLERQAMIRQFQAPLQPLSTGSVLEVARAAAAKLADLQQANRRQKSEALATLALRVSNRIEAKLKALAPELEQTFRSNDTSASVWVRRANVGTSEALQFHGQLVKLARHHQFFANLSEGSWWNTLTMRLLEERLRFLVAVVRVGSGETGIGAVLIQAERLFTEGEEQAPAYEWLFEPSEFDRVPITGDLTLDAIWPEVDHLLESCLSASIAKFTQTLA